VNLCAPSHVFLHFAQSLLTGESAAVNKQWEPVDLPKAVVQDKVNMAFSVGRWMGR
jgi:magnesium-transporting ATPase (P-type)